MFCFLRIWNLSKVQWPISLSSCKCSQKVEYIKCSKVRTVNWKCIFNYFLLQSRENYMSHCFSSEESKQSSKPLHNQDWSNVPLPSLHSQYPFEHFRHSSCSSSPLTQSRMLSQIHDVLIHFCSWGHCLDYLPLSTWLGLVKSR